MNEENGAGRRWQPTRADWFIMSSEGIAFFGQVVLCALFYNTIGQRWLLYLGWALLSLAVLLGWRARAAFQDRGAAHQGESWLQTSTVVATGIYALVRHPMYLSFMLVSLALVLLSQHWLDALLGAVVVGLLYSDMYREEKHSLARFGVDYRRYMERVPRMNVLSGIVRRLRTKAPSAGA